MSKDKGLVAFQGGGNPNETRETIRQLKENMPEMIEHVTLMAQLTKEKYDALIDQGFTPEQSLELSKKLF